MWVVCGDGEHDFLVLLRINLYLSSHRSHSLSYPGFIQQLEPYVLNPVTICSVDQASGFVIIYIR